MGLYFKLLVYVVLSVFAFANAPSAADRVIDQWSSYRADNSNTGRMKCSGAEGRVRWKVAIAKGVPSEVVESKNGLLFLSVMRGGFEEEHSTYLYALRVSDGGVVWKRVIAGPSTAWTTPAPAVDEQGNVYISAYRGDLLAFRGVDGKQLWSFEAKAASAGSSGLMVSSPKMSGSMVYVAIGDCLYAVDRMSGVQQWSKKTDVAAVASPAFSGDRMYLASENLLAIDPITGNTLWSKKIAPGFMPTCREAHVYVAGCDGKIYCVDNSNGQTIWSSQKISDALWGMAIGKDGTIYIRGFREADCSDRLMAVDGKSGELKWEYASVKGHRELCLDGNGVIYTTLVPKLIAVDSQTRKTRWTLDLGLKDDYSYSSPSIGSDGTVYVADGNRGTLYAIE